METNSSRLFFQGLAILRKNSQCPGEGSGFSRQTNRVPYRTAISAPSEIVNLGRVKAPIIGDRKRVRIALIRARLRRVRSSILGSFHAGRNSQFLTGRSISSVLELGAGTGFLTRRILQEFQKVPITAVDLSDSMLDELKKTLSVRDRERVFPCVADMDEFEDNKKYSLICSSFALQWSANPLLLLSNSTHFLEPVDLSLIYSPSRVSSLAIFRWISSPNPSIIVIDGKSRPIHQTI